MKDLINSIRQFSAEREWQTFHSPKNLSMALSIEASEIMEHFQWLTCEQSQNLPEKKRRQVTEEIGDVMIYLTNLSDKLGVDPVEAAKDKLEKAKLRYPVEKAKGVASKYNDFD